MKIDDNSIPYLLSLPTAIPYSMNLRKTTTYKFLAFCVLISLSSCFSESFKELEVDTSHDSEINDSEHVEDKYKDFDFKTVHDYEVRLRALNLKDQPISGAYIELYTENPLNGAGILSEEARKNRIYRGITDAGGQLTCRINPAIAADSLYILPQYIGLPSLVVVPLQGTDISLVIGGKQELPQGEGTASAETRSLNNPPQVRRNSGFYVLGDWYWTGRPLYVENDPDQITNDFLASINASLPEGSRLPLTHPQYLANEDDANLHLVEDAEVSLTFVHEGAGYQNTLGYYTYPTDNPPASVSDINDLTIIFPDVSLGYWHLYAGDNVELYYLNPETNQYQETFPAGISVGWFLISNGWPNFRGDHTFYSNPYLNPEPEAEQRKHNVLLYDEATQRLVLGFEDVIRNGEADEDFNDAIFYTTVSPSSAINTNNYQPTDTEDDEDGDGTSDIFDEFPTDPTRAFNNHYPAENQYSCLAFEDLWPARGDYDFNDLVLDYQFNPITNSANEVIQLDISVRLKAIGASFHNAFAVELPIAQEKIASVSGQNISNQFLQLRANGTESNQSNAVIFVFEDAYDVLIHPGIGSGINTEPDAPYVEPAVLNISIAFTEGIPTSQLAPPPYNPFIVVDGQRTVEIHLPDQTPTSLADVSLFGTGDDDSDMGQGKYYVSDDNLPWALNVPVEFEYPAEKKLITQTYLHFDQWAVSRGSSFLDWYEIRLDNINLPLLYRK